MAHIYLANGMRVENAVELPPRFTRRAKKPLTEIAGPVSALAVGTGSLPASRAKHLLIRWESMAVAVEKEEGDKLTATVIRLLADDLRTEMGLPKLRQPEENVRDEPRRAKNSGDKSP